MYDKDESWCSDSTTFNSSEYIQVDLLHYATIRGIATQGDEKSNSWLKTFFIKYSYDNTSWFNFTDDDTSLKVTFSFEFLKLFIINNYMYFAVIQVFKMRNSINFSTERLQKYRKVCVKENMQYL